MAEWTFWQRAVYRYLGAAYAFTYWAGQRRFLGVTLQGWLKFLAWGLLFVALIGRWGGWLLGGTAVFLFWLYLSFWRAKQAGYSQFVPARAAGSPVGNGAGLPPYTRQPLQATGLYSVLEFDKFVLLRPAEYWRVPLGQQIVMVEQRPKRYLYQFFNGESLQHVEKGWLIFGLRPLPTLAITFISAWGERSSASGSRREAGQSLTIYLSSPHEADLMVVWRTIVG
jgi:hypothetical protein